MENPESLETILQEGKWYRTPPDSLNPCAYITIRGDFDSINLAAKEILSRKYDIKSEHVTVHNRQSSDGAVQIRVWDQENIAKLLAKDVLIVTKYVAPTLQR